jgi:hypothetical protein
MPPTRRTLVPIVAALLVALAGCSGAAPGGGGDEAPEARQTVTESSAGDGGDGAKRTGTQAESGDGPAVQVRRAVVRTGHVRLRVEEYDAARTTLTAEMGALGGFVSDSSQEVHRRGNRTWTTGTVTYRVPSGNFSAAVARAKAAGEVRSSETSSEDVSDQLVDLEARLSNLRAQRERLRALYRNASDTGDVLEVEQRLSEVQGRIERLEAQKRSLERQVALSTLTVDLAEPEPDVERTSTEEAPPLAERSALTALFASVDGVVTTLRALTVATAYLLPYLVVFGLPLGGVAVLVARYRDG